MYVVMNRVPVRPEYADAFEQRFRERAGEVDRMPGFLRTIVLRPEDPATSPYVVLTMWKDKASFEAWTRSEAFTKGHSRSGTLPKEAFRGRNEIETFTAFVDSGEQGEPQAH